MKRSICMLCMLLIALFLNLAAIGQTFGKKRSPGMETRIKLNFNREWKFILKDIPEAQSTTYDDRSWEGVNLPHSFSIPYFMWKNVYTGYGWYRKKFDVPAFWNGKTVTLEFEGSFIETELYVNGNYVGKHIGGYTGFNFDITKYLITGTNLIAVRVNNLWNARVAPRTGDHQFSGGIYRDVYMNITDKLHVDWCGTFITTPVVSKASAVCKAQTEVRNDYPTGKKCTVKTEIVDPHGNIVSTIELTSIIPANSVKIFEQTLPAISNPKLWSPSAPYLHKAITTISYNRNIVDNYETTFGIRWFKWTSDRGFFLNGAHLYLLGANVHQDHAGWGDAVTNAAMKRDVKLMKDAGFNSIRGSHYPHDPAFTQACDELGMIFFSENAFWGMGGGSGDRNGWVVPPSSCYPPNVADQPYFDQSVLDQLKEEIKIHRNRASIAAWSMCNEPFFTDNSTLTAMKNLLNIATDSSRKWDPSRDVAIGGAQRQGVDKLGKGAIAFYNGDGASLYPDPGVPNMVSEYGSTTANRPGKFMPGWGDVKDGWNRPSWRSGQVIWCGFDHGTIGGEALATMGLVDYFRIPKRQYYWYQEAYAKGNSNPAEPIWPAPGIPAKLKLESSDISIASIDGTDDAHLIVTVLDANGKHISNNVPVKLSIVSGPGEFPTGASIDFVPPSSNEASDIVIRDGQAAIEFRSYYAGKTLIKATSPGLVPDSIEITIQGTPLYRDGITPKTKERPYHRYSIISVPASVAEMLLVKNRPVKVSSTLSGTSKSNVNDDNPLTIWQPETADTEKWCWLHLEASYCLNRIQLEFPSAGAYRYIVEVSADGINWAKVIDQTESGINDKIRTACGNLGRNVSYIRIRFSSPIAGLAEVRVGGSSTLPVNDKLLTGTIIGTSGSWNNNANATKEAAFDFDTNTFFDAPLGATAPHWVGLDFGYQAQFNIKKISYIPRSNVPERMLNGIFEVANKPDFSDKIVIYTITTTPSINVNNFIDISNTCYARYMRYVSPSTGNGNVAELEFFGVMKPQNGGDSNKADTQF